MYNIKIYLKSSTMYLLQNASQKIRRIVINRRLEKCLHMMPKKKKEILNTSNSFRSRSFENRSRCYIFKNNSSENVNFQWNIKWKEKKWYTLSPECFSLNTNIFERIVNKFYPGVLSGKFICGFILYFQRSKKECFYYFWTVL